MFLAFACLRVCAGVCAGVCVYGFRSVVLIVVVVIIYLPCIVCCKCSTVPVFLITITLSYICI